MPATAPTEQLRAMVRDLNALAGGRAIAQARLEMAEEGMSRTLVGFEKEQGPWGQRWDAPKYRSGKALQDTGRLRASIHVEATPGGFRLFTNVVYAAIHNFGGTIRRGARGIRIPMRQFLPKETEFPNSWQRSFRRILVNRIASSTSSPEFRAATEAIR